MQEGLMTNITPEEVATRVEALRRASGRFDLLDCEAALQVADLAEALAARVAEMEALTNPINIEPATVAERDMLRLCTQAAEAEVARLRDALRWQADQPEAHPFMAQKARAALTTKEQTNE